MRTGFKPFFVSGCAIATVRSLTFVTFITVLFSSCMYTNDLRQEENVDSVLSLNPSNYGIFAFDTSDKTQRGIFNVYYQRCTLMDSEVTAIEMQLKNCIKEEDLISFAEYQFQLIPAINKNNEKEVWVNGFCDKEKKYWRNKLVQVLDGGACYFNVKINLSTGKYFEFDVNGNP